MERRLFLKNATAVSALTILTPGLSFGNKNKISAGESAGNMQLGVISGANNPEEDLKLVRDLGFPTCQLSIEKYSPELAKRLTASLQKYKLKATSLICMGPGAYVWNFTEGPATIGLIPREKRPARVERLMQGIDFCKAAGIPAVHAHFGFIPEDPKDILYSEFINTMKPIGEHALKQGIDIHLEPSATDGSRSFIPRSILPITNLKSNLKPVPVPNAISL